MTDMKRIMEIRSLPESFLEEEVRCDFKIDKKRKGLWALNLDLVLELDTVCKAHGIKWFLFYGGILGAVRHNGFIPWDDDLDVGLLREDYDKLLALDSSVWREPYFFQTPYTDKDYFFSFAKLRNCRSTSISIPFRYQRFNQGMSLDIFPIDNCLLDDGKERFESLKKLTMENSAYMRRSNPEPTAKDIEMMSRFTPRDPMLVYEEMIKIAIKYREVDTEWVNETLCTFYPYERGLFRREWLEDTILVDFEGFKLPIPRCYDEVLKTVYGDYMKYPPVEQRCMWHKTAIVDPFVPYTEYCKEWWK